MACFKLTTVFFVYFSVAIKTFAQDVEPSCDERWSLEYEVDNDGSIPEVLDTLTVFTFKNYTINIRDCESDVDYPFILDNQYIWDLRFNLYNDTYDTIVSCRDCTLNSLVDFRDCMAGVRTAMSTALEGWDAAIQEHLEEIKSEAEKECVVVP